MVGPCSSCGPFTQYCGHQSNSFSSSSMFWSSQYHNSTYNDDADHYIYSSSSSSSSSPSVDCTLSLGTPSTRLTSTTEINNNNNNNTTYDQPPKQHTPHRNSVSSFCWDLLHPSNKQHHQHSSKPPRSSNNSASDSLLARRCANCDTTSTPLWRNGPRGPKSLCNACGIRFKKEERRAAAATNTAGAHNNATSAGYVDPSNGYYNGSWTSNPYATATTPQKMQSFGAPNEFRFIEDDQRGSEPGIQFLSWLTHDRPSGLVHDFTR